MQGGIQCRLRYAAKLQLQAKKAVIPSKEGILCCLRDAARFAVAG